MTGDTNGPNWNVRQLSLWRGDDLAQLSKKTNKQKKRRHETQSNQFSVLRKLNEELRCIKRNCMKYCLK